MTSGFASVYVGVNTVPNPGGGQGNTYRLMLSQANAQANPNVLWTIPRAWCIGVADCVINVLVYNNVNNPNQRAQGSITVSSGQCATTLQAGVSVAGSVTQAGESYANKYKFRVPSNYVNVSVRLTMLNNGNADLYCSFRSQNPTYTVYDWSSTMEGDDEVYFDYADPLLAGLRIAERYYYCAVMRPEGSMSMLSTYNILYTFFDESGQSYTLIPLLEGIPIEMSLRANTYAYFTYTPSPANYPVQPLHTAHCSGQRWRQRSGHVRPQRRRAAQSILQHVGVDCRQCQRQRRGDHSHHVGRPNVVHARSSPGPAVYVYHRCAGVGLPGQVPDRRGHQQSEHLHTTHQWQHCTRSGGAHAVALLLVRGGR